MEDWMFKDMESMPTEAPLPPGAKVEWVVIEENVTKESHVYGHNYSLPVTLTLGSLLTSTAVLSAVIITAFLIRQGTERRQPVSWLFWHYSIIQVVTVILLLPAQIDISYNGRWRAGPLSCRLWILFKVLLNALSTWSALSLTVDRLFHAVRPRLYETYMNSTRVTLLGLLAWLAALVTALPVATSMWHRRHEGDGFIMDQICIVNLSSQLTIGLSAAQFYVPAFLLLCCTVLAAVDAVQTRLARRLRCYIYDTVNSSGGASSLNSDDVTKTQSNDIQCATAIIVANLSLIIWCLPYYSVGLTAAFCHDKSPCVSPNFWQATLWFSMISCTVTPLAWLIDNDLRQGIEYLNANHCEMSPKKEHLLNKDGTKYSRIQNKANIDRVRLA